MDCKYSMKSKKEWIYYNLDDNYIAFFLSIFAIPYVLNGLVLLFGLSYSVMLGIFIVLLSITIILEMLLIWADTRTLWEGLGLLYMKSLFLVLNCHCFYHPIIFLFSMIVLIVSLFFLLLIS